jgi:hypothetical protein
MRLAIFLLLVATITSCEQERKDFKHWKFQLSHPSYDIGWMEVDLPESFDTLHVWRQESDYTRGELKHYRVQSSKETMREERRYFEYAVDSITALTVMHYYHGDSSDRCEFNPAAEYHRLYGKAMDTNRYRKFEILDTVRIHDHPIAISAYADTLGDHVIKRFEANTCVNDNWVNIEFIDGRLHSDKTSFIDDCRYIVNSIRFSK